MAGVLQMLLGILKMGKIGDMFPASVVNGMLATIGITIFVKQLYVATGVQANSGSILETMLDIPESLTDLNPIITVIAIISLLILIIHPKIQSGILRKIPAPLIVLLVAIPIVFFNAWIARRMVARWRLALVAPWLLVGSLLRDRSTR